MNIFFFAAIIKHPVIIIPGLTDLSITASYNNAELNWYCPETLSHDLVWFPMNWTNHPKYNCLFQILQVFYAENKLSSRKNISFSYPKDFDTLIKPYQNSIQTQLDSIFVNYFSRYYNRKEHYQMIQLQPFLHMFEKYNYKLGKNLMYMSYDWRFTPFLNSEDLGYDEMKITIEKLFKSQKQKVIILSMSTGGNLLWEFLSTINRQWHEKYIQEIIFVSPTFTGVPLSFQILATKQLPFLENFTSYDFPSFIDSLPLMYSLLPKEEFYYNHTIVINDFDQQLQAKDLQGILKKKIIQPQNWPIMDKSIGHINKDGFGIPTYIIYNSGIKTPYQIKYANNYSIGYVKKTVSGDGITPANCLKALAKNWKDSPLIMIDLFRDHPLFNHFAIPSNPYVGKLILDIINSNDEYHGKIYKISPYVTVQNSSSYIIHDDIRPWKTDVLK